MDKLYHAAIRGCLRTSLLFASTFASFGALAECRDILEQGIRNTYQGLRTNSFRSTFSNSFCNNSIQEIQNGSNGELSFGIPIGDLPFDFGGRLSQSDARRLQETACGDSHNDLSDENYERVLSSIADPAIVDAWRQCESSSGGLLLTGKLNGSILVLSLTFRNVGPVSSTDLQGDPAYNGINCPSFWKEGTVIDGSTKYIQCTRIGNEPVTVTINSRFNGALFYIPPVQNWTLTPGGTPRPHPEPTPSREARSILAKVCIQEGNEPNRCPANESYPEGAQCSCQPPYSFSAFQNGRVRLIQATVFPAPGSSQSNAPRVIPAPR